ncbi:FAD-binding oxidoreductase [Ktedonosporobacter rubrisoli]|uniref:FAD-binding oxidoreductase n=1 Tax=Ktedonosporobacter rubrisoli TaxID=2509675 RepID=A0A4P6K3J5_KTERU|nr:FAD-binding oxidoreductase [Ktedonosporobacter rubrisoli]QBD82483.1 FAD-binding oxidoreductase [Ktedonosporobacter rubrisoli]
MTTADVIIIGAGVNGASTAFHLAQAGVKRIVVLERKFVGAGASGKSGALVRTSYGNKPETELALESLTYFKHWKDLVGGKCGYRPVGLLLFTRPQDREDLETNVALHQQLGVNTRIITPAEAQALDPSLYVDDVTHVVYEPESGFADPNATTYSFMQAASAQGVEFRTDTPAVRIIIEGERVKGVATAHETIEAPVVIVIAGAWANQLFAPLGLDLGLIPRRARVSVFRWPYQRSPQHLTYLDRINRMWARPIDGNCTLVGVDREQLPTGDPDDYAEGLEQDYIALCREYLSKRFPGMQASPMRGGWACMLMDSPDGHPMIGALPAYQGLYCMAGDSGTSFKTAPAIGKCLSELITRGSSSIDLTPFRPSRFAENALWQDDFRYGIERARISR